MQVQPTQPNRSVDRELVPRVLLRAVGLLILTTVAIVSYARWADLPPAALPPESPVVNERVIIIDGQMSGAARVFQADGTLIADLSPESGGFIAGVWRALARERTKFNVDPLAPVRLVEHEDGRLSLHDTMTPWRIQLIGFGRDNAAAFQRLLEQ